MKVICTADKQEHDLPITGSPVEEKMTCPVCSPTRKKSKDKCLGWNNQKMVGRCVHCEASFFIKHEMEKNFVYEKPTWKNNTQLSDKVIQWFEGRKISQKTVEKLKITQGVEWMPSCNKEVNTIQFNYFRNGELVNIKYRDGAKGFKLFKGAELIFYNLDAIKNSEEIYIVEGECFHPNAEVLTKNGWIKISDYNDEMVAQHQDDGTIVFVTPLFKIKKPFDGNLIEYSNNRKYYSLTTPDHDLVLKHKNVFKKIKANNIPFSNGYSIPRTALHNGRGIELSDMQIRLCVAISADFTLRETGDLYAAFKKERKKERLIKILNDLKIEYTLGMEKRGFYSFFIRKSNRPSYAFKLFPNEWIYKTTLNQKKVIIDEILFWDGNSVPNRSQIEYSSKEKHNCDFIQTIVSLSGYCSTIIKRKNKNGEWYKVSVLFKKTCTDTQSLKDKKRSIKYNGDVYCLTVPSGMLLVRQNDCISVSGNCDVAAMIESGIENVVSVPNGASATKNNMQYLDNCIEYFIGKKIHLALDNDLPGRKLREELADRLGKENCDYIEFFDFKDANDCLIAKGIQGVIDSCSKPKLFPLEGVFTIDDISDEIDDMYVNGLDKGKSTGIPGFDCNIVKGYLYVITGIPSHGKSDWLDNVCLHLKIFHSWDGAFYSPENKPTQLHFSKMARKLIGKHWDGHGRISEAEKELVKKYLNKSFWFIKPEKDFTLSSILRQIKNLQLRYGLDFFVIDAWNKLEHKGKGDTEYIGMALDELALFCEFNSLTGFLVAHPTKIAKSKETGKYEVPTLYNIAGSANFYNKADVGICVYRDFETNKTIVYRQKIKFDHWGTEGDSEYTYEINSKRYFISGSQPDYSNWITKENKQTELVASESAYNPNLHIEPNKGFIEEEEIPF